MSRPLPQDGDQLPTELGRPLPRPEPPKPGYTPTETPGVYKAPDGKLVTAIPENERARWAQPRSFFAPAQRLFSAPGEYDVETSARYETSVQAWPRPSEPFKRRLAIGQFVNIEQIEDGLIVCEPTDVYETSVSIGIVTRIA